MHTKLSLGLWQEMLTHSGLLDLCLLQLSSLAHIQGSWTCVDVVDENLSVSALRFLRKYAICAETVKGACAAYAASLCAWVTHIQP